MINLLITVIVIALVAGIFWWAVGALPFIPAPIAQIIRVVIMVVASLYVISVLLRQGGGVHLGIG